MPCLLMSPDSEPQPQVAQTAEGETDAAVDPAAARPDGGLAALFERQAELRPGQLAVICGRDRVTYGDLDQRANQMARFLETQGVGPGDSVAFLLPRSAEVYAVLLGILKAGAAYVPLDPEYPADRVGFILSDCGARAVVTTTDLAAKTAGFTGATVVLDDRRSAIASGPAERRRATVAPDDLCYVIYTSGTTGRPKGVQIEHRNACHLVRTEGELFQVRPEDQVYQGFSIAFDASVEEVWLAFHSGATLVAATAEMVHAGPALAGLLTKAGVTVLSCVPTLLAMMEGEVPSLRLLILGGGVPAGHRAPVVETRPPRRQHLWPYRGYGHRHLRRMPSGQTGHHRQTGGRLYRLCG